MFENFELLRKNNNYLLYIYISFKHIIYIYIHRHLHGPFSHGNISVRYTFVSLPFTALLAKLGLIWKTQDESGLICFHRYFTLIHRFFLTCLAICWSQIWQSRLSEADGESKSERFWDGSLRLYICPNWHLKVIDILFHVSLEQQTSHINPSFATKDCSYLWCFHFLRIQRCISIWEPWKSAQIVVFPFHPLTVDCFCLS